jgi:hypothetical protein
VESSNRALENFDFVWKMKWNAKIHFIANELAICSAKYSFPCPFEIMLMKEAISLPPISFLWKSDMFLGTH